jgi:hypothetical protein
LFAIEYLLCPALEQNLGHQRLKDDREEKTVVKLLLIQALKGFDDQGICKEASPALKRLILSETV